MKTIRDKKIEQEANTFACLLLMPKELIQKDLENEIDLAEGNFFIELAKKYDVPLNALVYRISLLKNKNI